MNDAVDRLLEERAAMERGLSTSLVLSSFAHAVVVGGPLVLSMLLPKEPPIKVIETAFTVVRRGGGGTPITEPPAPQAQPTAPPETAPPEPAKPKKPEVVKPPKDEPRKGLAELDPKKTKKTKPEKTPPPRPAAAGGVAGGTGTNPKTPGIEWAPAGPGLPDGTDLAGDWYLASVQQKIWMIWMQQIKTGMTKPAIVSFTIEADGNLGNVELAQSSDTALIDLAAKRAVYSAAPFGPLPRNYGTNRITIQGIFKPAGQ